MSILDGQPVDAATSNPSWISKNTDDTTPSKLGLGNTAPESGTAVTNTQTELNAIDSFTGNPINSLKTSLPSWTNNDVGSSSDNLKVRADAITAKFNATTGHKHTGAAGDAPQIQSGSIANTPFRGVVEQGSTLSGITGGSTDVSAYLVGKSPSSNTTTLGVVINTPYNKVIIRDGNNTEYFDGSGNIVYARLTFAASVWTLTYYSDVVGIETAYSFASSSVIKWYYQELFNPLSNTNPPPVYNEFAFIPSDNATADILPATTTTQGKVQLATSAQSVGSANSGGTANATVANADHVHQGVRSVAHSGDAAIYGDVTFSGTGGTTVSEAGQNIQITSPALSTNSPQPVGSSASAGTGTASSKDDHAHVGVHSVAKSGSPQIVGDATFTGGTNITLTQVAQNIDIALSGIVSIANGGTGQSTASAAFAALSPMTTAGDIIYENATPTPARLPVGSNGQVLTVVSGLPAWQTGSSGTGGGLPNLLTMDSTYQPTQTNNQNFETTIGTWVAYSNTAGTSPVNMTGGSPNTTIAQTTSTPLDGAGSALMTINSGASRQGEGVSTLVYVPPAFRGKNCQIFFPFTTTGTLVEDDFKVYAYIIDGASAGVVTPFWQSKILGAQGVCQSVFPIPTDCTQLRVGIHIARTSTGAATIKFDDVFLTNVIVPIGMAGSDWISYTPTFVGLGTPTSVNFFYRRVGKNIQIMGTAVGGTATATTGSISWPSGISIDSTIINGPSVVGRMWKGVSYGFTSNLFVSSGTATVFNTTLSAGISSSNEYTPVNGNTWWNSGEQANFWAEFPVSGWSSNVQMANSAQFNISSYLANGTQVTGTSPKKIGEYRSMIGTASSSTLSDSTPTILPNNSDGILYYAKNFASSGVSGNISRWEFFVGKNKQVKFLFYSNTGRTGWILTDVGDNGSTIERGTSYGYDPTTGVVFVDGSTSYKALTTRSLGLAYGPANTSVADVFQAYVDVVVSENALAVGVDIIRNQLTYYNATYATGGSVKTFTFASKDTDNSQGSNVLYTSDTTNGDTFTVLVSGLYSIHFSFQTAASAFVAGFTKNYSTVTTAIYTVPFPNKLSFSGCVNNNFGHTAWTGLLHAGDVIRIVGDGNFIDGTSGRSIFTITQVGY